MRKVEFFGAILAVAGGISTLAAAGNWIVKLIAVFKSPNAEQDRRLQDLERHMEAVDGFLANDKRRLDGMEESTRVTQRALIALLGHGLDGNNQKQMEDAKKELESYLINR